MKQLNKNFKQNKNSQECERQMKQLSEDIKQGNFKQLYLFYGEEGYLRRQYRDRLQKALCSDGDSMNTHFYEGKDISVGEIIDLAETLPFLADHRVIFINDSGLFKSGGEKMAEYLMEPNETTYFVFTESEVDKRSKLFNTVNSKGYAAEFTVLTENTLKRWMVGILNKEGKRIADTTLQMLLTKIGTDMENIQTELEKLICYCMDKEVIDNEDVEAVCTTHISDHIFQMIDAIAVKKQKEALEMYYDLLALKTEPITILSNIARHCNRLLHTKELKSRGYDLKSIASQLGVQEFAARKYLTQAAQFKTDKLKEAVTKCVEAEEAVKSGRMNRMMSVEILILSVF